MSINFKHCHNSKCEYLKNKKNKMCGMKCKYTKYGYCDRKVLAPPCFQWKIHLESFNNKSEYSQ